MSMSKKIVLKSSDGEIFEVEKAVALQSQTIAHMVEDDCIDNAIPVDNVTGETLAKVIEYCKKHVVVPDGDSNSSSSSKEELKTWDAEFMKIDLQTLFNLIMAANFLDVKNLLDLSLQTLADMIPGKTPEEIRTMFNIENDFTPEEEAENRKENPWALG